MDYKNRRRVKIWGKARVVDDPEQMKRVSDDDYPGIPEQAIFFDVLAWDINCPQHIIPRFTEERIIELVMPLRKRIEELETQLKEYSKQSS
jgi:predicted pyridoxine 5'-phosphate oxidase superfamily flavin-nucleotide-binding protein